MNYRNGAFYSLMFSLILNAILNRAAVAETETFTLNVRVSGAQPRVGQAICALFNSAETFLKQPLRSQTQPIDANGEARFQFEPLTAGTYAVSVVYDEDSNGELNTGLLGIPTELVGMSNNAKELFGPPSFEQTAFALTQSLALEILLGKAKD